MNNPPLSQEYVQRLFNYDPDTGRLTWRISGHSVSIGQEAGKADGKNGRRVRINYYRYKVAIIIWVWMTGHWPIGKPDEVVDHRDTNPYNNRWKNLRLISQLKNSRNRYTNLNNTTGFTGVDMDKRTGKYRAHITVNMQKIYLGTFLSARDAAEARKQAEDKYWK